MRETSTRLITVAILTGIAVALFFATGLIYPKTVPVVQPNPLVFDVYSTDSSIHFTSVRLLVIRHGDHSYVLNFKVTLKGAAQGSHVSGALISPLKGVKCLGAANCKVFANSVVLTGIDRGPLPVEVRPPHSDGDPILLGSVEVEGRMQMVSNNGVNALVALPTVLVQ